MEGYRIVLPDGRDTDRYQIQFMKDSSRLAIINGDTHVPDNCSEIEYIRQQHAIITRKLY